MSGFIPWHAYFHPTAATHSNHAFVAELRIGAVAVEAWDNTRIGFCHRQSVENHPDRMRDGQSVHRLEDGAAAVHAGAMGWLAIWPCSSGASWATLTYGRPRQVDPRARLRWKDWARIVRVADTHVRAGTRKIFAGLPTPRRYSQATGIRSASHHPLPTDVRFSRSELELLRKLPAVTPTAGSQAGTSRGAQGTSGGQVIKGK